MYKLFISSAAQEDLLEIKRYITEELENPNSAKKVVLRITKRLRDLIDFPQSGVLLSSKINLDVGYRYIVCDNYLAFYRVEKDEIYVDRVMYGRRDYMKILFDDNI